MALEMPDDPGSLSPWDITDMTYESWVSKYNVQDVAPPPAPYAVVGLAAEMDYNSKLAKDEPVSTVVKELTLPVGYMAKTAYCHTSKSLIKDDEATSFLVRVAWELFDKSIIGDTEVDFDNKNTTMGAFSGAIPISIFTQNVDAWILNIEILCERTDEAYDQWRLTTYQKIMGAYNLLKAAYDNQVAQAKAAVQMQTASVTLTPDAKREIERRELQRACITLLAGDYYNDYDATKLVSAQGYPEFDLAEAASEAYRVQFFQQVMEWGEMAYLFYPHFWGRKDRWVDMLRLDDDDPVFAGFLKAGYARVVVPVQPAYEDALLYFLESNGVLWNGGSRQRSRTSSTSRLSTSSRSRSASRGASHGRWWCRRRWWSSTSRRSCRTGRWSPSPSQKWNRCRDPAGTPPARRRDPGG